MLSIHDRIFSDLKINLFGHGIRQDPMIKTVIIDDEKFCIEVLESLLTTHYPDIQITGSFTDPIQAITFIQSQTPDVVFLDINMPGMNGFDVLDNLMPFTFKVVFTTAYDNYAIKAMRYGAIDYVMKPIAAEDLVGTMTRVLEEKKKADNARLHNERNTNRKISIVNSDGMLILPVKEILYCEADNSYTVFHLSEGKRIIASRTLKDFESILLPCGFYRIHNSYLINLAHVQLYSKSDGGQVKIQENLLPVSRTRKDEFLSELDRYLNFDVQ